MNRCYTELYSHICFQTTEDVRNALCDWFEFECRGTVKVKGKGEMTTYWLLGRKTAKGLPSPRPFAITDGSKSTTHASASPMQPPNSTAGDASASKSVDKVTNVNETSGCPKSKHAPLQQTASNSSTTSVSNKGSKEQSSLTKNKSDSSIGSQRMTQSPTSSLTSAPLSPSGLVRAYEQEHAQKIDLQMNMPTPPGSLSRRRNNLESPRDSRNPLKKFGNSSLTNCISSQGPPSECSSTYMRVDSPELPAVHFRNVKMGESEERHSTAIQNDLFDSLKVGLDSKHAADKAAKGKRKSAGQKNSGDVNNLNDSDNINRKSSNVENQPPPPIPAKNRDSLGLTQVHYQSSTKKTSQNQYNSELGRPIVPYQVSNPIVPHMQKTPLVQAGLTNPILAPMRPAPCQSPKQVNNPSSLFFPNTQAIRKDLASIEEVPPEEKRKRSNMLKELERTVNSNEQNKKKEKPPVLPKSNPNEATYSVINKNSPPGQNHCSEQFVTAVYREPIAGTTTPNKSPSATPPIRSTPVPRNPPRTTARMTPNSVDMPLSFNDKERPPVLSKLPPRPTPPDTRKTSEGTQSQRSSTSSQSTITPTSGNPIVASIDGKTMSLLPIMPPPTTRNSGEPKPPPSVLKRSPSDSTKDRMENRKSVPQVKRSNSSPKMRPRALPIRLVDDPPHHFSVLSDDDESVVSHQQSENSSVVLLQPIQLKARPAFVRQISHPDHHISNFVNPVDYGAPHIHRHLSRSSDTINSIPLGQRTPKFPLTTAESTSLTQLLQELANDHPTLELSLHKDILGENDDSDCDFDNDLDNGRIKGFSEYEPLLNGAKDFVDGTDTSAISDGIRKQRSKESIEKGRKHSKGKNNGQPGKVDANPFQVKRRQNYTIPPRYCRSLDYIPSDREDHVSSNQSSACGSPKSKHDISAIQAYMLPFFSGRNPLGIESISVSSIASSSEMSRSDPALNTLEGGSSAYESEYDNYRPGMTSDEDFFHPDPVSDMDIDIFDDVNVDNVTVSDHYSLDLPPLPVFPKKKITDV